jgi:YfiH family protein
MMFPYIVQSPLLRSVPGVYHAFTGVDPVRGRGWREVLGRVFSVPPSRIGTLRQTHSGIALEMEPADAADGGGRGREGDALWTAVPGTGVGVSTADCVPILLAHETLPIAAAVHAGWRGLAAGVIRETVRAISLRYGSGVVRGLAAAAGPSAKACCYEVGEDVASALRACPGGERRLSKGAAAGKWRADLQYLALDALAAAGLERNRVEPAGPCTVCSSRLHSFRREKSLTGRQLSFIYRMDFSEGPHISPGQDTP